MSDKRVADSIAGAHIIGQIDTIVSWKPVVTSATDYYPFGMQMPGRYTSDTATHCFEMTQTKLVPYFYSQYFSMTSLPFVVNPYSATLTSTPGGDLRMSTAVGYVTIDIDSLVPGYSQTLSMVETGATATFDVSVLCLGSVVGSTVMNSPGTYNITFTPTTPTATIKIQRQFAGTPARYIQFSGMYLPRSDSSTLENVVTTVCNGDKYQYGYNGQMKVNEWAGAGNHNTALFWEYDTRTGRRANLDPIVSVAESPYATLNNSPILKNDPYGDCTDCPKKLDNGYGYSPGKNGEPAELQDGSVTAQRKIPESYKEPLSNSSKPQFDGAYSIRPNNVNFLFSMGSKVPSIYDEFRGGTGPKNSLFLDKHPLTNSVKKWSDVEDLRFNAYKKFESLKAAGEDIYKHPYTNYGNSFNPFLTLSGAGQFIGSFSGDVFPSKDGKALIFVVSDAKGLHSQRYHAVDDVQRMPNKIIPYGTTIQKYMWSEPYNSNWFYREVWKRQPLHIEH